GQGPAASSNPAAARRQERRAEEREAARADGQRQQRADEQRTEARVGAQREARGEEQTSQRRESDREAQRRDARASQQRDETRRVAEWGANAIVVPIAQDLALHGSGLASSGRYLEAIDQTVAVASAAGLYSVLQLSQLQSRAPTARSTTGLEYDPAVPDPVSIHLWGYLGQRYSREAAVLFDVFAHPRDPDPTDSTAALLPRLDWIHWRRWLLAMLGELRRGHPRSLVIIRAAGTDLSNFPLTYIDD